MLVEKDEFFARNARREEEIKCYFANNCLQNIEVFAYETVDSTNTRAKLYAKSCGAGLTPAIFISRAQSAGRGTRARTFESPFGAGLYMSVLLPQNMVSGEPTHLTSYTAVAVSRAIFKESCKKLTPKIKWVNDLVINDKKLGGILTEASFTDLGEGFFIVGIGINLKDGEHTNEVRQLMTSLDECGVSYNETSLTFAIVNEFFTSLEIFDSDFITSEYRALSSLIGRAVTVSGTENAHRATVIDIDNDRAILLQLEDGSIKKYFSGDVTIRPQGD